MDSIYVTFATIINLVTAVLALGISLVILRRVLGYRRRPRTLDLSPGMYWFRDGKVEDGWLEWRPVSELFR